MADRYWVGGAGTWDATTTTNWSATSGGAGGASAPTLIDNVIFNSASNATAYAVTLGTNANALDITIAGPATGNVTITAASSLINLYGSWTNAATSVVFSGSGSLVLWASTTGKTITTNGVSLGALNVIPNNATGGWTLGSAIAFTGTLSLQGGSFNTGNYSVTCANFSGSNAVVRSLTLGTSTITLDNTAAWTFTTTTNLTFNAGTSTIIASSASVTFSGGGLTYYNVSFTSVTALTHTIQGANAFNNLTFTSRTTDGVGAIVVSANQTISGTLTLGAANTAVRRLFVRSDTIGTQRTLTVATIATLADVDFQDTVAAGASGTFSGTRLGNCTNNSNITFGAGQTVYWNLAGAQNWSAVAWATSSGGAPAVNNFPLAQDTAIFDDTGSVTGTITIQIGWNLPAINITKTGAMTLANGTQTPRIFGGLTLQAATVTTGTGAWTYAAYGVTSTFTSNTATFTPPLTIQAPTGTVTLADGLTQPSTVTTTLTAGTLNLNNFTLSTGVFNSSNANTRTITTGTGSFTVTGNATAIWGTNTATNLTYTSGVPTVNATYSGAVGTRSVNTSAGLVDRINLNITAGTDIFAPSSTFGVNNYNFTGFSGTLTAVNTSIYGSLTLSSTMTVSAGTGTFTFKATSGTNTITSAGKTMDFPITFDGVGGTWQLQDALTSGATRTVTLTNGTLDLVSYTLTSGLFTSAGTNTLAFGTGNITLTGTGTIFTGSTLTTVTGTPQVICTDSSATARTINPGLVSEANAISFRITAGTGTVTFTSANSNVLNLDFTDGTNPTGYAGALANINPTVYGNFKASTGMTKTAGTGTITFGATSGTKTINTAAVVFDNPFTFNGVGGTFQLASAFTSGATRTTTLTAGTLDLASYTLTTGLFSSSNSNTRVLAFGTGKIVLTGTNSSIWVTNTATNLTLTGTRTVEVTAVGTLGQQRSLAGGSINAGGSSANAANFYITAGTDTLSLGTVPRAVGTVDFTGFSGSTLANTEPYIYGNLILSAGMTVTPGTAIWTFATTTSQTITTNGKTLDFPITFDGIGGTFTCQDALTLGSTQALTMTNGTLQLKSGTTNTVGSIATSGTNQKFLSATTPGTQATLSDASGTNSVSYLTIQDSNATGGAIFNAFRSDFNVDSGNNTGWEFGDAAVGGNGNTFAFGFGFRI